METSGWLPEKEAARWTAAILPVIDTRLNNLVNQGFNREEVEDAWEYFKSRVAYWNGQQAANGVTPVKVLLEDMIK